MAFEGRGQMDTIGLARALAILRQELAQAQDEGQNHQFRLEITEAEAEFLIEIDTEGGAEVGGSIGVVTLKAGGKVSRANTNRLKLKLRIKDAATGSRNLEVHRDQAFSWDQ
jgi:Trypsin-co-occurring domain 2